MTVHMLLSGLLVSRCGPGGKTDDLEGSAYGARGIETHCGHIILDIENHSEKGSPRGASLRGGIISELIITLSQRMMKSE